MTVHTIDRFGPGIVRLEVLITERPIRRGAAFVLEGRKVFLPETWERGSVDLGVPTHVVMNSRVVWSPRGIVPRLSSPVPVLQENGSSIPVLRLLRQIVALLNQQDPRSGVTQSIDQRPATRACPDDYDVVVMVHFKRPAISDCHNPLAHAGRCGWTRGRPIRRLASGFRRRRSHWVRPGREPPH